MTGRHFIALTVISLCTLAGGAQSEEDEEQNLTGASLHDLNAAESEQRLTEILDQMDVTMAMIDQKAENQFLQCMRVVPLEPYCRCLANELPVALPDFVSFVVVIAQTQAELGYEALSPDDQKVVDAIFSVRDACVSKTWPK